MATGSMYKILFRLYLYHVVEKVGRAGLLIEEWEQQWGKNPTVAEYLHHHLGTTQSLLGRNKKQLNSLFSDPGEKRKKSDATELQALLEDAREADVRLAQLTQWLNQLPNPLQPLAETQTFLQKSLPLSMLNDTHERLVLLQNLPATDEPLKGVLVEVLDGLQKNNMLHWIGLSAGLIDQLYLANKRKLVGEIKIGKKGETLDKDEKVLMKSLAKHLLSLRILGPAYYYRTMVEAIGLEDEDWLHTIEPVLFHGLNYMNFTDKTLVILHEACEQACEFWGLASPWKPKRVQAIQDGLLSGLEDILAHQHLFRDKHFQRSIISQSRLQDDTLLSASPHSSLSDIGDAIHTTFGPEGGIPPEGVDTGSVYQILSMVMEDPHTPLEIVNAGWVHQVNRTPGWLYETLCEHEPEMGYDLLRGRILQQDRLMVKSMETAEVHRMLLGGLGGASTLGGKAVTGASI